ncbi:MAG: UDP-galactopyranose mutase [Firmicutes bacterium]|nr:UDP-galactopyranose mutase [Bacillota bacterium]
MTKDIEKYDCIVAGAGFAGAVAARELAERGNKKVLLVEKRSHIGGNSYDELDDAGILIHKYGPHIFHTNLARAYNYLSRFTQWRDYQHEVAGNVYGKLIPVPFNLNSLHMVYESEKADRLEKMLVETYGMEKKVTILELKKDESPELAELADYVYRNVFLYYTQKQWGLAPEEIDPAVTARVPVFVSRDNRYFQDTYQGIPKDGYTPLFEKMLDHPNIEVLLNTDIKDVLGFEGGGLMFRGMPFSGTVIFTGAVDELFDYRLGQLPYRTLDFLFETYDMEWFQKYGTVNYTVDQDYTRITEFKHLSGQVNRNKTTIMKEYPRAYTGAEGQIPYYSINNPANDGLYEEYRQLTESFKDFHLLGRLAEYKYYNMDAIVFRALQLSDSLIDKEEH